MAPRLPAFGWRFDPGLIPPFIVVGLALSLHGFGALAAAQRFNDADWKRPDMNVVCRGIRAEGVANLFAALFNSLPLTSSGGAVGLAAATGCTSRIPAYWLGGTMILFAFIPKVIALWLLVPVPVIGASAIFLSAFTVLAGMQMIASRMLDNRKILAVGLALTFGLSHEPLRHFYDREVPASLHPISMSSVALGITVATLLSALFRIGARTRRRETFDAHHSSLDEVVEFLERQGRSWGARPGVVRRAEYATWQAFEILADHELAGRDESDATPIELETVFDEFTFTVIARYRGRAVAIDSRPPTHEEMIEDETAVLRMAGYLLRRLADRVQTWDDDAGRAELRLTFTD
jgi:NCS2 family nucleobase:cation symporter-2